MRKLTRFSLTIFFCLVFLIQPFSNMPVFAAPVGQDVDIVGCAFGYTSNSGLDFNSNYKSFTNPTTVSFGFRTDDGMSGSINVGFNFKFFERQYNQIFISTNGFLSLGSEEPIPYSTNYPIPSDFLPNTIIAPFWGDLYLTNTGPNPSSVKYELMGSSPNRNLVIEWIAMRRVNDPDGLYTFQVQLRENGDIYFGYKTLEGSLTATTIGIEDGDGVDGLQLYYNQDGLTDSTIIKLTYPPSGARLKAFPRVQGGFLEYHKIVFPITIVNTGTTADSFQLSSSIVAGQTDWEVEFQNEQNARITSTTQISSGGSVNVNAVISAPESEGIGTFTQANLVFRSNNSSTKTFTTQVTATIPAPFAQVFVDSGRVFMQFVTPDRSYISPLAKDFTGSTLFLTRISEIGILTAWENNASYGNFYYKNIKNSKVYPSTAVPPSSWDMIDHSTDAAQTEDTSPAMAIAPDGRVGVAITRLELHASLNQWKTNVYLSILDRYGHFVQEINLTQDNVYRDYTKYYSPVITATNDNGFVVAWEASLGSDPNNMSHDILLSNVRPQGTFSTQTIAAGTPNVQNYFNPSVSTAENGQVFVAYVSEDPNNSQNTQIFYQLLDPPANTLQDIIPIIDAAGFGLDSTPLGHNKVLVSWITDSTGEVAYSVIDGDTGANNGTIILPSPDGRAMATVSVTNEAQGHAILTWNDDWSDYLYYALVGPTGDPVTPPVAFRKGFDNANPNIFTSANGGGITSFVEEIPWIQNLPALTKQ